MRHKFTREETMKGVKNAVNARKAELKLKKKDLKERSKEWFWEQVGKLSEAEKLPYIAAFSYGAIAAAQSHKELDPVELTGESFRQGIEAILFLECAKTSASSLAGNAAQIFGVAGLTAIGLQVPLSVMWSFGPAQIPAGTPEGIGPVEQSSGVAFKENTDAAGNVISVSIATQGGTITIPKSQWDARKAQLGWK